MKTYYQKYYYKNKEKIALEKKLYWQNNKKKILNQKRKYYQLHRKEKLSYMKEWKSKNKIKVAEYRKKQYQLRMTEVRKLLGNKCSICGYHKCLGVLEFHHKKGKKEMTIGAILKYSWKKIKKELKKCILICANCHREIHYKKNVFIQKETEN
jgi:hypothetical protein